MTTVNQHALNTLPCQVRSLGHSGSGLPWRAQLWYRTAREGMRLQLGNAHSLSSHGLACDHACDDDLGHHYHGVSGIAGDGKDEYLLVLGEC